MGGTSLLNGVVDMESDLYVDGDVSLNSKLYVGGDVSFNNKLKVYGVIDASSGVNAATSSVVAATFAAGSVEQFDISPSSLEPVMAGSNYIHFSVGFQVTGDISQNSGAIYC